MRTIIRYSTLLLVIMAIGVQLTGCSDEGGVKLENEPPTVWLSGAPPEGSVSDYTIRLYWGGWDPDGEIDYYEYVITNNESGFFDPADTTSTPGDYKWSRVVGNDSTFTFSADVIPDSSAINFGGGHRPEEFRRSHTFFIRAVDEQGLRSPRPAYRSFTARTLSPTIFIDIPTASGLNPAQVPPITTFRWTARDYVGTVTQVQPPDSVRHILLPISNFEGSWDKTLNYIIQNMDAEEWSDWVWYSLPGDSGKFWTSPPLDFGSHLFAAQAKDEAGAVSPVIDLASNLRRLAVGPRFTGPLLTVFNQFIGTSRTSRPDTPPFIIDVPTGVPMQFRFEATAEHYGGAVAGYRYGWDILDLNDDEQWEIDLTPFVGDQAFSPPRTFFFGTHSFFLEVVDNSGYESRVEVRVNIVPFTMENNLLLVDDWNEGADCFRFNGGIKPCEDEHDAFWEEMLNTVQGFDMQAHRYALRTGGRNEVPIQVLARYKNVIWYASGNSTGESGAYLDDLITFRDPAIPASGGRVAPPLVQLFMAAGGHVLVTGKQIMPMVINLQSFTGIGLPQFPMIFRYELQGDQDGAYTEPNIVGESGVGEQSFAYRDCCLNVLDQIYLQNPAQQRRLSDEAQRCPISEIRDRNPRLDGLRTALPLDTTMYGDGRMFPPMQLREEVAGPGKFFENSGLNADLYNPEYFSTMTPCGEVAELDPPRDCFIPMYGNGCNNEESVIYNTPVAFWTATFADRIPDAPNTVAARSVIWGFNAVFFEPDQVKQALEIILHDEWQLPRN